MSPRARLHIKASANTPFNLSILDLWLQGVAVVLPQVQEYFDPPRIEFVTLSLYAGLIVGATTWGSLADVIGRKLSWQITLFLGVRITLSESQIQDSYRRSSLII